MNQKLFYLLFVSFYFTFSLFAEEESYDRVVKGSTVVKNKLFSKENRPEIGINFGGILNQSYVTSFLLAGEFKYHFSEIWGLSLDGAYALNSNKKERDCIETFYNDPDSVVDAECEADGPFVDATTGSRPVKGNYGPADVPIRALKYLITAGAIWTPVYGKQILLLAATSYFDLFINLGGGIAISDFYPEQTRLKNGRTSRGEFESTNGTVDPSKNPGADPTETYAYGTEGRPDPESQTSFLINLGIGQKFFFAKKFTFKVEIKNYTLLGTASGIESSFGLLTGLGVIF